MEQIGQVYVSHEMVPAVRIVLDLAEQDGFLPIEWNAHRDAYAEWENQTLRVVSVILHPVNPNFPLDMLKNPLPRTTVGGLKVKLDDSLPPDSLFLYGERKAV